MCKTYDVSVLLKEIEQGKQRQNDNFSRNLKQLPRILKSNHLKNCL